MIPAAFQSVLEATGYLTEGQPAPGVLIGQDAQRGRRGRSFAPDASWRSPSALTIYFKFEDQAPNEELVGDWRREIWNEGFSPLLWVISPERIDLYNGFGRPLKEQDAKRNRLQTFRNIDAALDKLDALAGRLAMETGQFWLHAPKVNRKTSVDQQLLSDLARLERDLVVNDLARSEAQALIGRSIFTQYLVDREIVDASRLRALCGYNALPPILRDPIATQHLFSWLSKTFNGDMFPPSTARQAPVEAHLNRVADFLEAVDVDTGQTSLFPYQFDIIPVELISSIYEQFAHSDAAPVEGRRKSTEASHAGVYYTRLPVVSLVLDEVMGNLTGAETILDLTCGSGVFLVEAFRRLVHRHTTNGKVSRQQIRAILNEQIFGVDISEAAVRVAAFSLYLAALEIDPDPQPPEALKFQPLIGKTLLIGDARAIERTERGAAALLVDGNRKTFDIIVGNPPWSFRGKIGTSQRPTGVLAQPRGEGLDFVLRAAEFASESTRFGMILSAMPFFSGSKTGAAASRYVVRQLSPITLVNLSNLSGWLFPGAKMPAVALFARHRQQRPDQITVVQVPYSPTGAKTHTFEIAPSDIMTLAIDDWEKQPIRLKAAAFGGRRDLQLLDRLTARHRGLGERLQEVGAELRDGLILGQPANRTREATALSSLDFLQVDDLRPFSVPASLPKFGHTTAQWPRSRDIYRAPLLLIKEFLTQGSRPLAAVSDRDLVFTDAYFGAALPDNHRDAAHILAGVLSSALASWFFIMTAAEFGLWKQRLFRQDVALLPTPDLLKVATSEAGRNLLQLEKKFQSRAPGTADWTALDNAVFDLYELDEEDRALVRDGAFRASWEWQAGRSASVTSASTQEVADYAAAFLSVIDRWLSARNCRRMRAEVFDLPEQDALRIVQFSLEEQSGPSQVRIHKPESELYDVLAGIGRRMNVPLATTISGKRELRIHDRDQIVIIKPAARRNWMASSGLKDADAVIVESFSGARA